MSDPAQALEGVYDLFEIAHKSRDPLVLDLAVIVRTSAELVAERLAELAADAIDEDELEEVASA